MEGKYFWNGQCSLLLMSEGAQCSTTEICLSIPHSYVSITCWSPMKLETEYNWCTPNKISHWNFINTPQCPSPESHRSLTHLHKSISYNINNDSLWSTLSLKYFVWSSARSWTHPRYKNQDTCRRRDSSVKYLRLRWVGIYNFVSLLVFVGIFKNNFASLFLIVLVLI